MCRNKIKWPHFKGINGVILLASDKMQMAAIKSRAETEN